MKTQELAVQGVGIRITKVDGMDFVCLTDIAKQKNAFFPADVIKNWMRSKMTVMFLGLWEQLNNPAFKLVEFDQFKNAAGTNAFVLPPQVWIERTNAIGLISKSGRYGGTYAHRDIAFEFASWVSVEFKLYLITEFERLKAEEQKQLGWSAKRELTKLNYRKWRDADPDKEGNIRDYATINELICLANLESLNAVMIDEKIPQHDRLLKLNQTAIRQMTILEEVHSRQLLKEDSQS